MSLDDKGLSANTAAPMADSASPLDPVASQPLETIAAPSAGFGTGDEDIEGQLALRNLERKRAAKRRKRRIKIIVACALVGGIAAVLAYRHFNAPSNQESLDAPAYETVVAERRDFSNIISTSGALKAGSSVIVTPEVDGTIEQVLVSEGQTVKKGDELFTLKNDSLDKAVREAQADIDDANRSLARAQNAVGSAQQARDEAWSKYYEEWDKADAAHREWADLADNYDRLHAEWEERSKEIEDLVCAEPIEPGAEPVAPSIDNYKKTNGDPDEEAYEKARASFEKNHDSWQKLYDQYIEDYEAYTTYQDALAQLGEEPEPAGAEPEYPEAPDDTSLVEAIESAQDGVTTETQALKKAQDAYDEAVEMADKRTVRAPAAGNVVALGAKVGQAIGGSSESEASETLVQISDVSQMSIDVEVNEIDILNIKRGQKATASFSAVSDVEVDAQVSEVATVATGVGDGGGVVTFHVGLVVPKPDAKLREGMTANVKIYTADVPDAIVVPASALSEGTEGATVQVVVDPEAELAEGERPATEMRMVKVGVRNESEAVIEEGLAEGDVLLIESASFDGAFMG